MSHTTRAIDESWVGISPPGFPGVAGSTSSARRHMRDQPATLVAKHHKRRILRLWHIEPQAGRICEQVRQEQFDPNWNIIGEWIAPMDVLGPEESQPGLDGAISLRTLGVLR